MNPSTKHLATIWPAGSGDDAPSPGSCWLSRALCLRYVLAEFRTQHLPVRDGSQVKQASWRWALGMAKQAEHELLGAWPLQMPLPAVLDELHDRGIEHIQAISAEDGVDCTSTYPDAVAWSACSDPHAASTFGPRRRAALLSAAASAERLQSSLVRAIKRCGLPDARPRKRRPSAAGAPKAELQNSPAPFSRRRGVCSTASGVTCP
jgi:hypothetical protein